VRNVPQLQHSNVIGNRAMWLNIPMSGGLFAFYLHSDRHYWKDDASEDEQNG